MDLLLCSKNQLLVLENEEFLKEFVTHFYSKDSYNQVYSKLNNHVLKFLDTHFSRFNYEGYKAIQSQKQTSEDVKNYANTFFKFLFFKEVLSHEEFKGIFAIEKVKEHFINRVHIKDKIKVELSKKYTILEFSELLKIDSFYNSETNETDELKKKFYWYILSEHDFKNQQILEIKSENFKNGQLHIGGAIIDLPNIYEELFERLSKLKNDGFTNLNGKVKELGKQLGINQNLTPTIIRNTKLANTITCPSCQENYSSDLKNWCAVEGKLVCKSCGESLKKIYSYQELSNSPIGKVNNYEVNSRNKKEYDSRKKKLIEKGVDFQRLNEILAEIGKLGEDFVYNLEYTKLIDTKYANMIDKTIADVPANGYDILSYEVDGTKLHIEVKTTTSQKEEFYITQNELNTAKKMLAEGEKYYVYFVKDILSEKPILRKIENILDDVMYCKVAQSWKVDIK